LKHHWHYHDDTERKKWQDPDAVMRAAGIKPGITFIEIGCGQGYFLLPAARLIGETGTVYGIDSNEDAVEQLEKKAAAEGLNNVQLTAGEAETTVVCRGCADIIFVGDALHDFKDAAAVLENARVMIKPGGKLVDVDWRKESVNIGPPIQRRFSQEYAAELITKAGFSVESIEDSQTYHYMITARPV
jgi:ubiquinone/menaquinone biosynthesis C-methylase UbiE